MNNREVVGAFPIPTPEISLGVLSPQKRHTSTYTKHMPIKELHTAMQPACPGKFPYRRSQQGLGTVPMLHLLATLCVGTDIAGTQTPNPLLTDQHP